MLRSPTNEKPVDEKLIDKVLAQVKDDLELIRVDSIFFLVLNRGFDNTFDDVYISKMSKLLD